MPRKFSKELLIKSLSSLFGLGYSPFIPGTLASLAGLIIYLLFILGNPALHLVLVFIISGVGFYVCGKAEGIFKQKDARFIVIDDFDGMLVSLLFLPYSIPTGIIAFLVFRVMDGLKPYPIYKFERFKGSQGVMLDDLIAAIYTNIVLQLIFRLTSANFS